ncbi:hypothetical protein [Actinomyces ruminicola]|uniref:hypothetical protein n=1 Tax=Actinomyces ruminicola TaxID=332524 RepID=UPI0015A29488|nr:hypothetical protein [Actinomyces ruminicola]
MSSRRGDGVGTAGGAVVDDLLSAEGADGLDIIGRGGGEHAGAEVEDDLHGVAAHSPRSSGDENGLPGIQAQDVDAPEFMSAPWRTLELKGGTTRNTS